MVIGSDQYEFIKIDIFAIGYLQQTSGRMRYNKEIKNDMTRKLYFTILSLLFISTIYAQYVPDILGDNYLRRTIQMPDDYEGKVVCTLVKKPQLLETKQAILYIHGYNDYFFQKQLGDSVNAHGYNFYAMDLRKYGRSILPNQNPFFCKSLKEYFADLFGWMMEKIVIPVVSCIGKLFPNLTVQGYGDASYAHSLLKQFKGEWVYNTDWKMINGHPKKAGWINAIQEAQKTVQKGIGLDCPVLVISSNKSFPETKEWNNEYLSSDIVLDIHDIQKYGQKLGNYVTRDTIQNGIHDLILSEKDSRDHVYRTVFDWLPGK